MTSVTLLTKVKQYLLDILGSDVCGDAWVRPWTEVNQLPFYLQTPYTYHQGKLFGRSCLLMQAISLEGETPAVVRKHWQAVSKLYKGDVIYVIEVVSSYNRRRLIEHRVPFLVPGNQLYLPTFGVDLREYFKPGKQPRVTHLSYPAQALLLREILTHDCSGKPAKDLAQVLGYSSMTITRAINELTEHQFATAEKVGREKHLSFSQSGRSLWESVRPALQSPVTKRIWAVQRDWKLISANFEPRMAGESALAHYTDLADTQISQWAIASDTWPTLCKSKDVQVLSSKSSGETSYLRKDREVMELELWAYNPSLITISKSGVDPLSLWLSFEANTDERIEIACESLLEQVWSTLQW